MPVHVNRNDGSFDKVYIRVSNNFEFDLLSKILRKKGFEWGNREYSYEFLRYAYGKDSFYVSINFITMKMTEYVFGLKDGRYIDCKPYIKKWAHILYE